MATFLSLTSILDSVASLALVSWLLRITLLCAMACAFLAIARRLQPAMRHAVAVGSLVAVVLLPAASKLLPAVPVAVLPAPAPAPEFVMTPVVADPAPITIEVIPAQTSEPTPAPVTAIDVQSALDAAEQAGSIDAAPSEPVRSEMTATISRPAIGALIRDQITSPTNWTRFGLVLWVMVATTLLLRLAIAFLRAHSVANNATVVNDEGLRLEVERACRVLGVTRFVQVSISDEVRIPMVCGIATPRVILPASAVEWSRERLAVVLLHEIAHIRRRDCVSMLFARVVTASLWFHPLVFILARHARRESELACDDLVLSTGVRGSDYAEHLVAIARMSAVRRNPIAGATLAFAARSTLEQRVASILRPRRRVTTPRLVGTVVIVSLGIFAATAAVSPTESECTEMPGCEKMGELTKEQHKAIQNQVQNVIQNRIQNRIQNQIQNKIQNQVQYAVQNDLQYDYQYSYKAAGNDDDDDEYGDDGESWYDRAHSYYMRGRWDKAARAYENAAKFGHNRAVAYYNAGCSWALAKQSGPAVTALENAFEEGFDDIDMYASDEDLNSIREDAGFKKLMDKVRNSEEGDAQRRAATREYDRMAGKKNIDEGDWNEVGIELMRAGDYDRASLAFDNEYKLSKNQDEDALYNKACAKALAGKTDDALKLLDQAIMTGNVPSEHMAEDSDLVSLHKDKKFDVLVDLAEDLELNYPGFRADSWSFNGKRMRKNGDWDDEKHWAKSLGHFKEMANKHPKYGRAWFNLGYAQLKSGDAVTCTPNFQKALDMGYKTPTMMYNLACSTALEGKIDTAFAWLDKSEKAGFEVWNSARWDDDLDPLKADPRWRELKKRWREEERKHAEAHGVHIDSNYD